jgi:hypothetical protein
VAVVKNVPSKRNLKNLQRREWQHGTLVSPDDGYIYLTRDHWAYICPVCQVCILNREEPPMPVWLCECCEIREAEGRLSL